MLEAIARIRQMMAESKFIEAQRAAELHLNSQNDPLRASVLPLYLELLELQDRSIPVALLLEAAESYLNDTERAQQWIDKIGDTELGSNRRRFLLIKISLAEKKGRLEELYELISEYQLFLISSHVPAKTASVYELIYRYFKNDFRLCLQELAIDIMLSDLNSSERLTRELIFSCLEKASPRKTKEKISAIADVLKLQKQKSILELYQNYCQFRAEGIKTKAEYKKLAELIIYFDDFRFQALLLDLLEMLGLDDLSPLYAETMKTSPEYDFVYLDKYFKHLKKYFVTPKTDEKPKEAEDVPEIDLKLEKPLRTLGISKEDSRPIEDEEARVISSLKYMDLTVSMLIELAVSFLQSEFPWATVKASEMAMEKSDTDKDFLKAAYLRATALYQLSDFRACLDIALIALKRAKSEDDLLSFMYLQAEALSQLGMKQNAKKVLESILSIDASYRLTNERLKRLDEV